MAVRFVDESTGFLAPASVEDFRADLDVGYSTAAGMFVTYGVGGVLGNLAVAATDGRSRKPVAVGGAVVTATALVVIGLAGDASMMLAGTGLIAVGSTCLVHGGEITVANALTAAGADRELERVLARINVLAVVGDLLAPLSLAALRAGGVEWRAVFVGAALLVAVYALALAAAPFPGPPDAALGRRQGRPVVAVHRQRIIWLVGLAAFVAMPLDEAYLATVLAFAEAVLGWSGAAAAALGAAFVAGGIVAFTIVPPIVARMPLATLMTWSGVGMSASMLIAASGPAWVLVPVGIAHSALLGSLWLGEQALVLRANPGREGRTRLIVELLEGAGLVAVVGIGVLADAFGLGAAMYAFAAVPLLLPVIGRSVARIEPPPPDAPIRP